jgi:glycosyltransferase involved in cell wall biosynthesis
MSKFGQEELQQNGFSSTLIPHGVNTKIFHPMDKKQRKIDLKMDPNMFVFGMVSENKAAVNPRKSFQQVMDAFKLFLEKKPNSLLYIHTDPDFPGGFPLKQYADFLGIAQHIAFPERYSLKYNTPKEAMNMVYNTFDCLLSPSSSEGFGLPVIEAQSCGVPVIVNSWTSMPEMIIDKITGYKVKQGFKIYYPIGSYFCFPDTQDLYEKMLYIAGMDTVKMGKSARSWIEKNYDQDTLFNERWIPFFERIEKEIYGESIDNKK